MLCENEDDFTISPEMYEWLCYYIIGIGGDIVGLRTYILLDLISQRDIQRKISCKLVFSRHFLL